MTDLGSAKVLLLEDEENVGFTLNERLKIEGYDTHWVKTLHEGQSALETQGSFDLALLDVHLPDGNGFDFAKKLRHHFPQTAIVFLTAAGTVEDRIHGLELGAEDYITKPFHFRELGLRLQKIIKRADHLNQSPVESKVQMGKAKIHFQRYELETGGETIRLSHKESALLRLLFEKKGQVISRDEILDTVWSEDEFPTPRTIDNFILRLRKWIEPNLQTPTLIRSIRGVGYLYDPHGTGEGHS